MGGHRGARSEGPFFYPRALRAPLAVTPGVKSKSGGQQAPYFGRFKGRSRRGKSKSPSLCLFWTGRGPFSPHGENGGRNPPAMAGTRAVQRTPGIRTGASPTGVPVISRAESGASPGFRGQIHRNCLFCKNRYTSAGKCAILLIIAGVERVAPPHFLRI